MVGKIKNIKNNIYFKEISFFAVELIYLVFIDIFNKYNVIRSLSISNYIRGTSVLFSFTIIPIILILLLVLKPKIRKVSVIILNIFLLVFSTINYFMYSYFKNIFSWKDIFLSGDGLSFISSIFKFINLKLILFILLSLFFIVLIIKIKSKYIYKLKSFKSIILCVIIIVLLIGNYHTTKRLSKIVDSWDSSAVLTSDSYYYTNWMEPPQLIRICGSYKYLIRDFYFSFLKKDNATHAKKEVSSYIDNYIKSEGDNYKGIFKDKNLIFVMMESMDNWMVSEKTTPTMYYMMQHGFNFTNHYSPGYVTGDTANTEFIANTGIYPYINKLSPNYAYVNNSYPFSIANLFKNKGYSVNSFHRSNGGIYNREKMHLSLGYEKYHNYTETGVSPEHIDLDSYIAKNGYEKITSGDKFMSFIITYSPHSPYTYDKIECKNNLDQIKKILPNETNEEYLCAYSSAMETDNMFKILIDKLKKDNQLDNTVIIAFTDHPNHIKLLDDETDKLNETVFFIYDSTMESNQIEKITSTINILPTVINLFDIENDYVYPGYDALNSDNNYVIFRDYTYYDGSDLKPITKDMQKELEYSYNILISNYYGGKRGE